jgi:hypothetical protein
MDADTSVTDGEEVEGLFKVLVVIRLEGGGPSFEFCFERHEDGERGVPDA